MTNNEVTELNQKKTVLITGASAGIGRAFAGVWAEAGFDLVLTARREARLEEIADELKVHDGIKVYTLPMDLADPEAPSKIHQYCVDKEIHIDALVNNAGYGNPGNFEEISWKSHQDFLQVMVTAVTELTYLFLPGMMQRQYGRIINLASLAPFIPSPVMAGLYSPVKIYQIKFSESVHIQYHQKNIYCSAVCPGLTYSEFHEAAGMHEVKSAPEWMWMDARTVAEQGLDAVMKGKSLIINGSLNKFFAVLSKVIPKKVTRSIAMYLSKRSY